MFHSPPPKKKKVQSLALIWRHFFFLEVSSGDSITSSFKLKGRGSREETLWVTFCPCVTIHVGQIISWVHFFELCIILLQRENIQTVVCACVCICVCVFSEQRQDIGIWKIVEELAWSQDEL